MAESDSGPTSPLDILGNIPARFLEAKHWLNQVVLWAAIVGILASLVGTCFRMAVHHI